MGCEQLELSSEDYAMCRDQFGETLRTSWLLKLNTNSEVLQYNSSARASLHLGEH
jgi:hypothetical protein